MAINLFEVLGHISEQLSSNPQSVGSDPLLNNWQLATAESGKAEGEYDANATTFNAVVGKKYYFKLGEDYADHAGDYADNQKQVLIDKIVGITFRDPIVMEREYVRIPGTPEEVRETFEKSNNTLGYIIKLVEQQILTRSVFKQAGQDFGRGDGSMWGKTPTVLGGRKSRSKKRTKRRTKRGHRGKSPKRKRTKRRTRKKRKRTKRKR
jgi:hypothetical protein